MISKFSSDLKKKELWSNFERISFFVSRYLLDVDIRKMKIVWNLTITFLFGVGRKFWNHFWTVIRPHFIDCNHLKNHWSTPFCILSKRWQFWISSIGYSDCQWTIFRIVTICSKYKKVRSDGFLGGYNR